VKLDWLEVAILGREFWEQYFRARLDGVHEIREDLLVFQFYRPDKKEEKNTYLHIQLQASSCSMYILPHREDAPESPPAFCGLMRKHLSGLRLLSLECPWAERVILLGFGRPGVEDTITHWVAVELQGSRANMILMDSNKDILGAHRHGVRAGEAYTVPEHPKPRLSDLDFEDKNIKEILDGKDKSSLLGLCRELTPKLLDFLLRDCPEVLSDKEALQKEIQTTLETDSFYLISDEFGIVDYSIYPVADEGIVHRHKSLLSLFSEFAPLEKDREILRKARLEALLVIEKEIAKNEKTLQGFFSRRETYATHKEIERQAGLLSTQRNRIKAFTSQVTVIDYFTENSSELVMNLDPRLGADANVQAYYNKAKKYKRGLVKVDEEIHKLENLLQKLNRLRLEVLHESDPSRMELFVQRLSSLGLRTKSREQISVTSKKKAKAGKLRMFLSTAGSTLYAGRNDKENDYLVRHAGTREDLWFHAKDLAGSHVLLKGGIKASQDCIREAAQLAAYLSKGREEGKLEVIYAEMKHVHSQAGGHPGLVKVDEHKTISVRMDKGIVSKLEANLLNHGLRTQA